MKYMLDTNICIYLIKRKPIELINKILSIDSDNLCISSITYSELCYGVEKSKAIERNKIALLNFLANIEVIDYDANAAIQYGTIRAYLENKGTPIGPLDELIAGHCKSLDYTLVTNNTKEFNRIPDLKIENWITNN